MGSIIQPISGAKEPGTQPRGIEGVPGQSASAAMPALADRRIVQDVKMIHFQSNHRQHTIRCPQKVYIVS